MNYKEKRNLNISLSIIFMFILSMNFSNAIIFEDNYDLMQFMNSSKIDDNILFPQENFIFTIPKEVNVDEISLFNVEIEKVELYCIDNEELIYSFDYENDFLDWENQRLTAFDLKGLNCNEFSFQMKFKDNGIDKIIEKKVRLYNTEVSPDFILSKINDLESDQGKAQMIYALNGFDSFDSIREQLINELKQSRDDENKCWPKNNCTILETTRVLYYLKISGLSKNRIYQDAMLWLSENSKIQLYNKYNLEISKDEDESSASCDLIINDESSTKTTSQNKYIVEIDPIYPTKIEVDCEPSNTDLFLLGVEDFSFLEGEDEVIILETDSRGNLEYNMPKPCLTNEKGYCDIESTFYFLFLDIDTNTRTNIFRFFSNYLRNEGYDKVYFNAYELYNLTYDNNINYLWTALFYYSANSFSNVFTQVVGDSSQTVLDNIENWLFYNQNNDGSWGKNISSLDNSIDFSSKIIDYIVKSEMTQNENLNDAKQYILNNANKIDSVENYANFYNMIKSDFTPFLNFEPIFLKVRDSLDVRIDNPTPYIYQNMILELSIDDLLISTYNTKTRQFIASKYLEIKYMASKESNKINIIRNELFEESSDANLPKVKYGYINVYLPSENFDSKIFKNVNFKEKINSKTIETNYYEFENSLQNSKESAKITYDLSDYILITQIPLVYINDPKLELNYNIEKISYDGKVHVNIEGKSQENLSCTIENDYTSTKEFIIEIAPKTISKNSTISQFSKEIVLEYYGETNKEIVTDFKLTCNFITNQEYFETKEYKKTESINIYESSPYDIKSELKITSDQHIITITNQLDSTQNIVASIIQNDDNKFFLSENEIILGPYETKDIYLENNIGRKEYSVTKIKLLFSGKNKEKTLELTSNINLKIYQQEQEKQQQQILEDAMQEAQSKSNLIPLIIILVILFIIISTLLFLQKKEKINIKILKTILNLANKNKKKEESKDNKNKKKDDDKKQLSEEQKELTEVIKIMQSMNKMESVIRSELQEQGFKESDVNKAYTAIELEKEEAENESKD